MLDQHLRRPQHMPGWNEADIDLSDADAEEPEAGEIELGARAAAGDGRPARPRPTAPLAFGAP